MPVALSADVRKLAESLWVQGFSKQEISRKLTVNLNTVKNWVVRGNWDKLKLETKAVLESDLRPCLAVQVAKSLVEESKRHREVFSEQIDANLQVLQASKPKSYADVAGTKGRKGRAEVLKVMADTADKVYGWSSESGGNVKLVQVNILAQVSTAAMDKE